MALGLRARNRVTRRGFAQRLSEVILAPLALTEVGAPRYVTAIRLPNTRAATTRAA
jgi:hypothetical protein